MRKILGLAALAVALACGGANAQQVNVKIGVLSDMSSSMPTLAVLAQLWRPSWRLPTLPRPIPP